MRGVWPRTVSVLTSPGNAASSCAAQATWPPWHARCNAVCPLGSTRADGAPAASSAARQALRPPTAAACSGAAPSGVRPPKACSTSSGPSQRGRSSSSAASCPGSSASVRASTRSASGSIASATHLWLPRPAVCLHVSEGCPRALQGSLLVSYRPLARWPLIIVSGVMRGGGIKRRRRRGSATPPRADVVV